SGSWKTIAPKAIARSSDLGTLYSALRAQLEALPRHAVVQATELKQELASTALGLGKREESRIWAEEVLTSTSGNIAMLELLVQLYREGEDWERLASTFERLAQLSDRPQRKAELLFQSGEALRRYDLPRANDVFLRAADLHPTHAPTLRRLISYYLGEGQYD